MLSTSHSDALRYAWSSGSNFVRNGSKAEVVAGLLHIRFVPEIGHLPARPVDSKSANIRRHFSPLGPTFQLHLASRYLRMKIVGRVVMPTGRTRETGGLLQ
jgi:hypothetical protein